MICRASHSAVGCRVTSYQSKLRRPCPSTRKANNRSKVAVGTTHISIAAIASAWLRRKVFQLCDGSFRPLDMYFETVDWATSKPSINSSPWMRGAPHRGFSRLIRRIRSRKSRSIFGRPAPFRDFQRQKTLKPPRCQRRMVAGLTTQAKSSSPGQTQVNQLSRARSLPRTRGRGDTRRKAILSWWRRNRFSAWSRRLDLNRSQAKSPSTCRMAIITPDDVMILAYDANPTRMEFSEGTPRTRSIF